MGARAAELTAPQQPIEAGGKPDQVQQRRYTRPAEEVVIMKDRATHHHRGDDGDTEKKRDNRESEQDLAETASPTLRERAGNVAAIGKAVAQRAAVVGAVSARIAVSSGGGEPAQAPNHPPVSPPRPTTVVRDRAIPTVGPSEAPRFSPAR